METDSIKFALETLECIFVSEYVYQYEIKKDTKVGRKIEKLKNTEKIKILQHEGLTSQQQKVYRETYKLLKKEDISVDPEENPINEGERITAAFAKACNIYPTLFIITKLPAFSGECSTAKSFPIILH